MMRRPVRSWLKPAAAKWAADRKTFVGLALDLAKDASDL
jgi:hypothetical protein